MAEVLNHLTYPKRLLIAHFREQNIQDNGLHLK